MPFSLRPLSKEDDMEDALNLMTLPKHGPIQELIQWSRETRTKEYTCYPPNLLSEKVETT